MSGFSSRNVRYPRYQDTDLLQLCCSYGSAGVPAVLATISMSDPNKGIHKNYKIVHRPIGPCTKYLFVKNFVCTRVIILFVYDCLMSLHLEFS